MKVAYLLRYYPTLTETFVAQEIEAVADLGHDVVVVSMGTRADGALQQARADLNVLHVPRRPLAGRLSSPTPGQSWLLKHQRPKDVTRLPWLAARLQDVDHLHIHFAGEAAEWAYALHLDLGLSYTVMVHANDLFRPRPSLHTVLDAAHRVVTVGHHHAQQLASQGIEATVVRCGPDLSSWRPQDLPDGPLVATFVGRDVPKKGLELLLEAWNTLERPGTLTLVTDRQGPLPKGATTLGLLAPDQVRQALIESNLFVLPCRRAPDGDMDGIPVALMEALALGRPVVTTALGAIPELVDDRVGWLAKPGDRTSLRSALREAADAPEQRALRGACGPTRLRSRAFTLDDQVTHTLQCWPSID